MFIIDKKFDIDLFAIIFLIFDLEFTDKDFANFVNNATSDEVVCGR